MIDKQLTSLTFSHHDGTIPSKFILAFYYLAEFFKKTVFSFKFFK